MMKIILSMAMVACVAFTGLAQQNGNSGHKVHQQKPRTPSEKADRRSSRMAKDLQLSSEQTTKVRDLILQSENQSQSVRKKYAADEDKTTMKTEMKTIRQDYRKQLKSILTPEQHAKLVQLQQQRKESHKQHHKHPDGAGS